MREPVLLLLAALAVLAGTSACGPSDSDTANPQAAPTAANPAAPPAPGAVVGNLRLAKIEIGRSVNPDNTMHDATFAFIPADTIWLSIELEGAAPRATVQARWVNERGDVVQQASQETTPAGQSVVALHAEQKDGWPVGKYHVDIVLNGVAAGSKDFEIRLPPL